MAQSSLLRLLATLALGPLFLLGLAPARASLVYLEFSGGNGSPVSITFDSPTRFEVTVAPGGFPTPFFVIDGAFGGSFGLGRQSASGLAFTVNGGTPLPIEMIGSAFSLVDLTVDDAFFYYSGASTAQVGDVVTLGRGVLVSSADFAGAAPVSGNYDMFIVDLMGKKIGDGVAIPEPATTAAWIGGVALLGVALHRRRRSR